MKSLYEAIREEGKYALASLSRDLVYKTLGKAELAYEQGLITWKEYSDLNLILVRDGLNNYRNIKLK